MSYWPGPDLKARTDLKERLEKARLDQQRERAAPERLRSEYPASRPRVPIVKPSLLRRLWNRLRALSNR